MNKLTKFEKYTLIYMITLIMLDGWVGVTYGVGCSMLLVLLGFGLYFLSAVIIATVMDLLEQKHMVLS